MMFVSKRHMFGALLISSVHAVDINHIKAMNKWSQVDPLPKTERNYTTTDLERRAKESKSFYNVLDGGMQERVDKLARGRLKVIPGGEIPLYYKDPADRKLYRCSKVEYINYFRSDKQRKCLIVRRKKRARNGLLVDHVEYVDAKHIKWEFKVEPGVTYIFADAEADGREVYTYRDHIKTSDQHSYDGDCFQKTNAIPVKVGKTVKSQTAEEFFESWMGENITFPTFVYEAKKDEEDKTWSIHYDTEHFGGKDGEALVPTYTRAFEGDNGWPKNLTGEMLHKWLRPKKYAAEVKLGKHVVPKTISQIDTAATASAQGGAGAPRRRRLSQEFQTMKLREFAKRQRLRH